MSPLLVDSILIAVLIALNAWFSGTELAIVSLRRSQVNRLERDHGSRGAAVSALANSPSRFLSTIQLGITLAGFLASATAAIGFAERIAPYLDSLGRAADPVAIILVTIVLTFITLVLGELVPKRIAMRHPERWALRTAPSVARVARFTAPVIWLLSKTTDIVSRTDNNIDDKLSEAELLDVLATETDVDPARRALVRGALELAQRTVESVLVPRPDVETISYDTSAGDAARQLAQAGRTRAPLFDESGEQVAGVVDLHALILCDADAPAESAARSPLVLAPSVTVQDALGRLQRERRTMAIVIDEHGRMLGICTVEDLLEEIVGELYDEHDRDLTPDDPRGPMRLVDGGYALPGGFPVHDLADLGITLGGDIDSQTVGGVLFDALGRIPEVGERANVGDYVLIATRIGKQRIERLEIHPKA